MLLPHTSNGKAAGVARSIEVAIAATTIHAGATTVHPWASIGIATIDEKTSDAEAALADADRAMYAAKRNKSEAPTTN